MEGSYERGRRVLKAERPLTCGRPGCACSLPIGERFVLWALRQWLHDRMARPARSPLAAVFHEAGLSDVQPDFVMAMEAVLLGARHPLEIHLPTCSRVSSDEAMMVALCGLAQSGHDGPFTRSLHRLMVPTAARVATGRLKTFAAALAQAGLKLAPTTHEPGGQLN